MAVSSELLYTQAWCTYTQTRTHTSISARILVSGFGWIHVCTHFQRGILGYSRGPAIFHLGNRNRPTIQSYVAHTSDISRLKKKRAPAQGIENLEMPTRFINIREKITAFLPTVQSVYLSVKYLWDTTWNCIFTIESLVVAIRERLFLLFIHFANTQTVSLCTRSTKVVNFILTDIESYVWYTMYNENWYIIYFSVKFYFHWSRSVRSKVKRWSRDLFTEN